MDSAIVSASTYNVLTDVKLKIKVIIIKYIVSASAVDDAFKQIRATQSLLQIIMYKTKNSFEATSFL